MSEITERQSPQPINSRRKTVALAAIIVLSFFGVIELSRWIDSHRPPVDVNLEEERLYMTSNTVRRMSLGFNGLVADWYWMRSLQYVGNKVIKNPGKVQLDDLSPLNIRLLYPLLDTVTTLDPQFMAAYQYGAVVLPAINEEDAIKFIQKGIEQNPDAWRFYQHLGYIYWRRGDYRKASETYGSGAMKSGAPTWMHAMSARMATEGGSHAIAREIYTRLYEQTDDKNMKELMTRRLMQVDSFEEREAIRASLTAFRRRSGRCPTSWQEVNEMRAVRLPGGQTLRLNPAGAPLDPSDTPYELTKDGCDVSLSLQSKVPQQ